MVKLVLRFYSMNLRTTLSSGKLFNIVTKVESAALAAVVSMIGDSKVGLLIALLLNLRHFPHKYLVSHRTTWI